MGTVVNQLRDPGASQPPAKRNLLRDPPRWLLLALGAAAILISLFRIVSTYPVFNQTYDEPISVGCGMRWLQRGSYSFDPKHPPLGRVATALGAFATQSQGPALEDARSEGNRILLHDGKYWQNLALARAGTLPFFVLASVALWGWAAWAAGPGAGLLAVVLFTLLPTVLGHAGLAMTDVALLSTMTLALFAWCLWLARPSPERALLLGLGVGLAVLSKFFALLFLPLCGLPIAAAYALRRGPAEPPWPWPVRLQGCAIALVVCALVIWSGYRFSFHVLGEPAAPESASLPRKLARTTPMPAPEFFQGLVELARHNEESHYSFFLGQRGNTGVAYYYPIVLAVKTPLAFWGLFAVGLWTLHLRDWRRWTLFWPVAGILVAGLFSHVNTGVRHILPIYAPLAGVAALGALHLVRRSNWSRALAGVLVLGMALSSLLAHPDYLAYFNELADGTSGRYGVTSDLDYGQDLARLGPACRRLGVGSLALAYYGTADPARMGLPSYSMLQPGVAASGWVAISMCKLKLGENEDNAHDYAWLEAFRPVALVGKSIRLYRIPPPSSDLN